MNKQELIRKYEELWKEHSPFYESVPYTSMVELFLKELKQLDEPEKGHADEAPRYVKNILARLRELPLHDREVWLKAIMGEFEKDFSRAKWLDDYEVEKEKRYLVKVKGVCGNHETLNCEKHSNEWLFSSSEENRTYKTKFTRKELEGAGFGWIFDCEGVEVQEVE